MKIIKARLPKLILATLATNGAVRAARVTAAVPASNAPSRFLRLVITNP